jgi:hypothetical protein
LRLVVALWDRDTVSKDDLVGSVELELVDLEEGVLIDDWFPLCNPSLDHRLTNSAVHIQALLRSSSHETSMALVGGSQSKLSRARKMSSQVLLNSSNCDGSLHSALEAQVQKIWHVHNCRCPCSTNFS